MVKVYDGESDEEVDGLQQSFMGSLSVLNEYFDESVIEQDDEPEASPNYQIVAINAVASAYALLVVKVLRV